MADTQDAIMQCQKKVVLVGSSWFEELEVDG